MCSDIGTLLYDLNSIVKPLKPPKDRALYASFMNPGNKGRPYMAISSGGLSKSFGPLDIFLRSRRSPAEGFPQTLTPGESKASTNPQPATKKQDTLGACPFPSPPCAFLQTFIRQAAQRRVEGSFVTLLGRPCQRRQGSRGQHRQWVEGSARSRCSLLRSRCGVAGTREPCVWRAVNEPRLEPAGLPMVRAAFVGVRGVHG